MEHEGTLGPVSYVIVEFPGGKMTGDGFPILVDLVDRGLIRVIDLKFLSKAVDGTVGIVELADVDGDGNFDFAVFEGASSGLVDDSDAAEAGSAIAPGSSAALLLFENRWATPFVEALRRGDAEVVAAGYIPHEVLVESLDAAETVTT